MTTLRRVSSWPALLRFSHSQPPSYFTNNSSLYFKSFLNLHYVRCCSAVIQTKTSDASSSVISSLVRFRLIRKRTVPFKTLFRSGSTIAFSSHSSEIPQRKPTIERANPKRRTPDTLSDLFAARASSVAPMIKPKIRTHYVNILNGNYDDDEALDHDSQYTHLLTHPDDPRDNEGHSIYATDEDDIRKLEQTQEALRHQQEYEQKRAKWETNSKAPVRFQQLDSQGRAYGRGGRKTASARVWIRPGNGMITVNRREFLDYFPREANRELILSPFVATSTCGLFDITAAVEGGGLSGKAGAIRHGLARALEKYDPDEYRPVLKRLGYLTRDARRVERKKAGLKKARKASQWVRR